MHTISNARGLGDLFRSLGPRGGFLRHGSSGAPRGAIQTLLFWQERARQRRALAQLDERSLNDLALSRSDVARECAKPFWRD